MRDITKGVYVLLTQLREIGQVASPFWDLEFGIRLSSKIFLTLWFSNYISFF